MNDPFKKIFFYISISCIQNTNTDFDLSHFQGLNEIIILRQHTKSLSTTPWITRLNAMSLQFYVISTILSGSSPGWISRFQQNCSHISCRSEFSIFSLSLLLSIIFQSKSIRSCRIFRGMKWRKKLCIFVAITWTNIVQLWHDIQRKQNVNKPFYLCLNRYSLTEIWLSKRFKISSLLTRWGWERLRVQQKNKLTKLEFVFKIARTFLNLFEFKWFVVNTFQNLENKYSTCLCDNIERDQTKESFQNDMKIPEAKERKEENNTRKKQNGVSKPTEDKEVIFLSSFFIQCFVVAYFPMALFKNKRNPDILPIVNGGFCGF